jgi:peptidoglycan/LPS O-acetylase OafA/YrhL
MVLHLPNFFRKYKFVEPLGTSAITLFFTMSGFLISYFLFLEKDKHEESKINLKRFYRTRVVRIWPLYFLCILLYWGIGPHSFLHDIFNSVYFTQVFPVAHAVAIPKTVYLGLFLLILPQLAGAIAFTYGGMAVYGGHAWSIGSEELFYLFWPLLLNKFRNYKKIFKVGFVMVYIWYLLLIIAFVVNKVLFKSAVLSGILLTVLSFLSLTRLYCMLIGGLLAYLYVNDHRWLEFLRKKSVLVVSVTLLAIMIVNGLDAPLLVHDVYSLLWAVVLLYFADKESGLKWLNNKSVSYLGSITYGVYMYHVFVIILLVYIGQQLHIEGNLWLFNIMLYVLSPVLTYILSHYSYKYFENWFFRFK